MAGGVAEGEPGAAGDGDAEGGAGEGVGVPVAVGDGVRDGDAARLPSNSSDVVEALAAAADSGVGDGVGDGGASALLPSLPGDGAAPGVGSGANAPGDMELAGE
mgnify:CR=1 FL=1